MTAHTMVSIEERKSERGRNVEEIETHGGHGELDRHGDRQRGSIYAETLELVKVHINASASDRLRRMKR